MSACPAGLSHCTSNLMYGYHYSAMLDRWVLGMRLTPRAVFLRGGPPQMNAFRHLCLLLCCCSAGASQLRQTWSYSLKKTCTQVSCSMGVSQMLHTFSRDVRGLLRFERNIHFILCLCNSRLFHSWATRHFFPKLLSLVAQARDQANGKVPYSKHPREDLGLQMPSEYLRRSSLIRADQQVLKDEPWMMKLFVTTWWSGWGKLQYSVVVTN